MDAPAPAPIGPSRPRRPRRIGLLAALVLGQFALGIVIAWAPLDQRKRARAEAFGLAEQAARAWARQVGENLRIAALTGDTLDAGDPWGQNRPGIRRVLEDFAETIPWRNTVFIADAAGRVVVTSQLRLPAEPVGEAPFFRHHLAAPARGVDHGLAGDRRAIVETRVATRRESPASGEVIRLAAPGPCQQRHKGALGIGADQSFRPACGRRRSPGGQGRARRSPTVRRRAARGRYGRWRRATVPAAQDRQPGWFDDA